MPGGSRRRVLEQIVNLVTRGLPEFDTQTIFENLVAREKLGSAGFGSGIAILYCHLSGYQSPINAVLYLDAPVDPGALDGTPVDLLFVLLVPEAATGGHPELLRQIAVILNRIDVCNRLCSAPTAEVLYQVVVDAQNGQ